MQEVGLPFPSEHFAPPEYRQYPQNWAVTQDHRGLIYAANNDGVLEYDGASWRLIPTTTNTFVRSLATADNGRVYVGTVGDVGVLRPDSIGIMRYVSLFDRIPDAHRSFKDVWGTHATSDGVYFQSNDRLFRWNGTRMTVWTSEEGFHTSFVVRDTLYVRDFREGLLKMEDDALRLVPGGRQFADTPVHAMVPLSDGRILIGSSRDGLFVYDGQSVRPFATEAQPFLDEYELYHGTALSGGHIALATIGGGVVIINEQGALRRVLGPSAELPDGVVHYVYSDREGGLWMAFNSSGLARAEVLSPLTTFDQRLGLDGLVYKIERHRGTLYVATGSGLFRLDPEPSTYRARQENRFTSFRRVEGVPIAWDLESTSEGLLVATDRGVFLGRGERFEPVTQGPAHAARTVAASQQYPGWFFVGERQGLVALHRSRGAWAAHRVPGVDEEVHSVVEGPDGTLWVGAAQGDVLRVDFAGVPSSTPAVERFRQGTALPRGFNRVTSIGDELMVLSTTGVFDIRSREEGEGYQFVRDRRFRIEGNEAPLRSLFEASDRSVWMLRGDRAYRGVPADGGYRWYSVEALHFPKAEQNPLFIDPEGIVWMGNGRELMRYDPNQADTTTSEFPVHIRGVTALQDQQTLYGGTPPPPSASATMPTLRIPYASNDVRFTFAAPHYGNVAPLQYQYRLEGHDDAWSTWQPNTSVVYSNLGAGRYTFRVRARTGDRHRGRPASLSVRVLPPWYRTWWAYGVYAAFLLVLAGGYRRYRGLKRESQRVKEQAKELERERMANERLQEANRRLKEANELKDNFLANTSHELRTPLTTILGFTDVLKDEVPPHHQEFLDIIEKSGQRLLRTLNAMLDLAKLRSGVVEAELAPLNVVDKSAEVMEMFVHDAERKAIRLDLDAPDEPVYARLDDRYYEQILDNLLSNAIKFTDEGHVRVVITSDADWVSIGVHDTGMGIEEAFMPYLFDDFKQESSGLDRDHEGNGLGLAITKRLVALMHGTIDVSSTKGEGSTFTVTFPRHMPADPSSAASTPPLRPEHSA